MEGIEKLEKEVLEMDDYNVTQIFNYLKTRIDLQDKFNNSEKSIKEMYEYVCDNARKRMKNGVAMIQDNLVYLWAVQYFLKSNEELGIKKQEITKIKTNEVSETKVETINKKEVKKKEQTQISLFNV